MVDEEAVVYLVFALIIPILAIADLDSFGGGLMTYVVVIFAVLVMALIAALQFADFIVFPLFTSFTGITFQPFKNYKITKTQEAVIKNVNGLYYATGFITANLFAFVFKAEQQEELQEQRKTQSLEIWEKIVMSVPFSFKFHVLATSLDIQSVRDELEGKRSFQEFQMSKTLNSKSASAEVIITDIQRKINVIQTQLDKISQGEKPIATLMYFETTAVGVSEKAALDALSAQVKQLQIASSSFDVQLSRIVGRELYVLFKYAFALPTTYQEMAMNFDTQK